MYAAVTNPVATAKIAAASTGAGRRRAPSPFDAAAKNAAATLDASRAQAPTVTTEKRGASHKAATRSGRPASASRQSEPAPSRIRHSTQPRDRSSWGTRRRRAQRDEHARITPEARPLGSAP